MTVYDQDIRALKRSKWENTAKWLIWRKGKFSPDEIQSISAGLESWVSDACQEHQWTRDQALESLKWARDNRMWAWIDIAHRCALPQRKIYAIRHCILRRLLPGADRSGWTSEETAEFIKLREAHGRRAWKQIALETGRTLEDVVNKGRDLDRIGKTGEKRTSTRIDTQRLKLAQLRKDQALSNPFEQVASREDCIIVALIRKIAWPDGVFLSVHDAPSGQVAEKLDKDKLYVRNCWHAYILPHVVARVHLLLEDSELMDAYLVLQLRKNCRGTLIDQEGVAVYPCYDWYGINWKTVMPLWPYGNTENRLRHALRLHPRFGTSPLPEVVEQTARTLLAGQSKSTIYEAADRHFSEIRRILTGLANRGDAYLAQS